MDIVLFFILIGIASIAGYNVLKSLRNSVVDAHRKTMKELHEKATKGVEPPSSVNDTATPHTRDRRAIVRNDFDSKEYIINTYITDGYYGDVWTTEVLPMRLTNNPNPLITFDAITDAGNIMWVKQTMESFTASRKWPVLEPKTFELLVKALVKSFHPNEWHEFFDNIQPPETT